MRLFAPLVRLSVVGALISTLTACGDSETQQKLQQGKSIVNAKCKACHAQGINGAPVIGNAKMWNPRIIKGREALVLNAINGNGLMPPRGGNDDLSDADIELAVAYLLSTLNEQ